MRRLLVPAEATPEIMAAMLDCEDGGRSVKTAWRYVLSASPAAGKVTQWTLRQAAKALIDADPTVDGYHETHLAARMPDVLAVVEALGLEVEP